MENSLRVVKYVRTEFHGEDQACEGSLLYFVYDIPYFGACGVFPPFRVVNQIFKQGSSGGGMSPGATWDPFVIEQEEYTQLVHLVQTTPLEHIRPQARYAFMTFIFDPQFDRISDYFGWMAAACSKHREAYHQRLRDLQSNSPGSEQTL